MPSDAVTASLEQSLGHVFADPSLLRLAMTHASAQGAAGGNERLEFLGDRVVGLAVASALYRDFENAREGDLAKRLNAAVRRETLAAVAEEIGVAAHLKISGADMAAGTASRTTVLADAFEALMGAVFLDAGFDRAVFIAEKLLAPYLAGGSVAPEDPKTALQEWAQARGLPLPVYRILSQEGADHAPVFTIEASLQGKGAEKAQAASKRAAEKAAAAQLLEKLDKDGKNV